MDRILTANWDLFESHTLAVYQANGGYEALKKALTLAPTEVREEVTTAILRGRGGAGFPAGTKWSFLPPTPTTCQFLVVNADEGEPGTFKDRTIMEKDPHRLLEGIAITAYAHGTHRAFIYIRGELRWVGEIVEAALAEAEEAGFLGEDICGSGYDLKVIVHYGAGAYICGEETALLESLEGKPGQPRLKPPFPAQVGLFGCPTIIHNVETLACVPTIVSRGGQWFLSLGRHGDGGLKIFGVSGHVARPGLYEGPMGLPLRSLIYDEDYGGGLSSARALKAVIPGGASCPVLLPEELDVALDFKSLRDIGSMMGTGCATVMDDSVCMVRVALRIARFFHHESCGQCTPCREGSGWITRILQEIEEGRGSESDFDLILDLCHQMEGNTICALGDAIAMPIRSYVSKFREEFREHLKLGRCPFPAW